MKKEIIEVVDEFAKKYEREMNIVSVIPVVITFIFIGLRLLGVVDWGFWILISPIWIPLGILFIMPIISLFLGIFMKRPFYHLITKLNKRR